MPFAAECSGKGPRFSESKRRIYILESIEGDFPVDRPRQYIVCNPGPRFCSGINVRLLRAVFVAIESYH